MLELKTPEMVSDYLKDRDSAASMSRQAQAIRNATDACYYLGIQYLESVQMGQWGTSTPRLFTTIDPDSKSLRVVWNEMTQRIRWASAATWPKEMDADIAPPTRDGGVEASFYTQTMEDLLAAWIGKSGFLTAAREANDQRCIVGDWGLMLRRVTDSRTVNRRGRGPTAMPDVKLEIEGFHPLRLLLDPAMSARDLRKHYEVTYQDVLTVAELRRMFPTMEFDESKMDTVGRLTPYEQNISSLSGGRLFTRYRQNSRSKGARVYQIHAKDQSGRWSIMYSAVDLGGKDLQCPNLAEPYSPFGGDGLPIVMIRGHPRPEVPDSISDVGMGRDAQDMLNIAMTQHLRAGQFYTANQKIVDRRAFQANVSDQDIRNEFTNAEGGISILNPRDRNALMPVNVEANPPSAHLLQMVNMASAAIQRNTFRSNLDTGETDKTHQSAEYVRTLQQAGGQVLGIRVEEDLMAYAQICSVALGTVIGGIQQKSPSLIQMAVEQGFKDDAFTCVLEADPNYPTCNLTISSASVRYRSPDEVKADLMSLATTLGPDGKPAVGGMDLRLAFAEMGIPAMELDKHMEQELSGRVTLTLRGQPWVPVRIGPFNPWCLTILHRATLDRKAQENPQIAAMIDQAIQIQQQLGMQDSLATNPELALQQAQMQSQERQAQMQAQATAQEPAEGEQAPPANIGAMLDQMAAAQ